MAEVISEVSTVSHNAHTLQAEHETNAPLDHEPEQLQSEVQNDHENATVEIPEDVIANRLRRLERISTERHDYAYTVIELDALGLTSAHHMKLAQRFRFLKSVVLRDNRLKIAEDVENTLKSLPEGLIHLDMSGNLIEKLNAQEKQATWTEYLPHLQLLQLDRNKMKSLPQPIPATLKALTITYNEIVTLDGSSAPPLLKESKHGAAVQNERATADDDDDHDDDSNDDELHEASEGSIDGEAKLKVPSLPLYAIELPRHDQLLVLDISHNALKDLSGINAFTNLQVLIIKGNQLSSIDGLDNPALMELDVSQNQLQSLSNELRTLERHKDSIRKLNISDNAGLLESVHGSEEELLTEVIIKIPYLTHFGGNTIAASSRGTAEKIAKERLAEAERLEKEAEEQKLAEEEQQLHESDSFDDQSDDSVKSDDDTASLDEPADQSFEDQNQSASESNDVESDTNTRNNESDA